MSPKRTIHYSKQQTRSRQETPQTSQETPLPRQKEMGEKWDKKLQPCKFCKMPSRKISRPNPPARTRQKGRWDEEREKGFSSYTHETKSHPEKRKEKKTRILMESSGKLVLLKRDDVKFHMRQQKEAGQKKQDRMTMPRRKSRQSSTHAAHAESLSTICIQ
jgi:hypothetical protein